MQKIALISEHASPLVDAGDIDAGGQNVYVAHVAKQLARRGFRVDVFTRRDSEALPDIAKIGQNIRVVHVPAGPPRSVPKEKLLPYMPAFGQFMLEFFRRESTRYDLMHANFFMSGAAALHVKAQFDIPLVTTFHALGRVRRRHQGESDGFPDERFAIEDTLIRESDRIIAECPQDRADLLDLYRADPGRIDIVPCGFDATELSPVNRTLARSLLSWPRDEFAILQLGRLVPRKGVDNVIRAVGLLSQRPGPAVRLYIVGGNAEDPEALDTPEIARLRGIVREAGAQDRVTFVGRRAREVLRLFYSAANVFVTTPWYEPFGITPVEAMACGVPVVGSAVGGIRTTVVDGQTGFLVPPSDPAALAERLDTLRQAPRLAHMMGLAGARRARELFTWEGVAVQLAALYGRLTGSRRPLGVPTAPAFADDVAMRRIAA